MTLGPGEYHPRIARPLALASLELRRELWLPPSVLAEKAYIASARGQLTTLTRKLETICQTAQPSEKTLDVVYGHEIRNLLILAATEVEMHWRGILIANGVSAPRNSNEYVKLVDPLKLLDYAITFHDFPDLQPVHSPAGRNSIRHKLSGGTPPITASSTTGRTSLSAARSGAPSRRYLRAPP